MTNRFSAVLESFGCPHHSSTSKLVLGDGRTLEGIYAAGDAFDPRF